MHSVFEADPSALKSITPAALVGYVLGEGWSKTERFGRHSFVYERSNSPELIIPASEHLGDYTTVIYDLLLKLSNLEKRPMREVFCDLLDADQDVIRVRSLSGGDDGSLPISDGAPLFEQAKRLLEAAACSAVERRATYRAGAMKSTVEYMKRVRLGQTERGSYVITMLAPVPAFVGAQAQRDFWPEMATEPHDRAVTRWLADGLEAAKAAAEHSLGGNGTSAFRQSVQSGVSANLCEALADLGGIGDGVSISVTWAKTRPTPEPRRTVHITRSEAGIFREAGRLFRDLEPRPDEQLLAFVSGLQRSKLAKDGAVTLSTIVDGRAVSVRANLDTDLYAKAVRAHWKRKTVLVTGELQMVGQRWTLWAPRNLQLVDDDSSESLI